jgi:hypothetical protein
MKRWHLNSVVQAVLITDNARKDFTDACEAAEEGIDTQANMEDAFEVYENSLNYLRELLSDQHELARRERTKVVLGLEQQRKDRKAEGEGIIDNDDLFWNEAEQEAMRGDDKTKRLRGEV